MSKAKHTTPCFSVYLSNLCKMMDSVIRDFEWNDTEITRMDKLTQDYLHTLELSDLGYSERAKIATKLRKCRQLRRQHKETVEVLEPLVTYLGSERGQSFQNMLKEVLGKTRKAEERMSNRVYRPRVMDAPPIIKKGLARNGD